MTASNPTYFIKNLKRKAETEISKGNDVCFSITVINAGKSQRVLNMISPDSLKNEILFLIKSQNPEVIKADLLDSEGRYIDGLICDLRVQPKTEEPASPQVQFHGFGEAELNAMVDKRFEERKRAIEHDELKSFVRELEEENDELHRKVDDLELKNEDLEEQLEAKGKVKYYAGLLGDILESFGIAKSTIKKPIAELMGINEEGEQKKIESRKEDQSGIVEESPASGETEEDKKRAELIGLIAEYLKTVSSPLLGQIFTIFSDIEENNSIATEIINFLNERKEATDAGV